MKPDRFPKKKSRTVKRKRVSIMIQMTIGRGPVYSYHDSQLMGPEMVQIFQMLQGMLRGLSKRGGK